MKIILENVVHTAGRTRGIGNYFFNLATEISRLDSENEYVLFNYFARDFKKTKRNILTIDAPNFKNITRRIPQRLVELLEWKFNIGVLDHFLPEGADVYHAIETRLPHFRRPVKTVVTVYDIMPYFFPDWFSASPATMLDACRRADRLISISRNTRDDLVKNFGIPPGKISVIHCGIDHETFCPVKNAGRLSEVKKRYNLPETFLLGTGPFEARRNTETLLEVYASITEMERWKDLSLVLTGGRNSYSGVIGEKVRRLKLGRKVIFAGFIPQEDLAAVYSLSAALVYPSFYEGFGLTLLEAMACGAPVVASRISSIPEVTGDAALLIDPRDAQELKKTVLRVLENRQLGDELRQKGLERAKIFSWAANARETIEIYRGLA